MLRDEKRRDPFEGLGSGEPAEDLGLIEIPTALTRRRGGGRQRPVRPSERRRRGRRVGVTFSHENADAPDRLRALARRWGLTAPDGKSPNVSAVVEHLLMPQLRAAEWGEIAPPERVE
jgi:hypothetical protein